MRAAVALLAAGILAAAGAFASAAPAPGSGLYGVVRKGPIRPVCIAAEPCEAPAQVTLVFSRRGHDVVLARSRAGGRYRAALAPGYYAVRTVERIGIRRSIAPRVVRVRRSRWDRIDFLIDTGIR